MTHNHFWKAISTAPFATTKTYQIAQSRPETAQVEHVGSNELISTVSACLLLTTPTTAKWPLLTILALSS
jgi:hypothetical protein